MARSSSARGRASRSNSFPGQDFKATITHIADRAEFTPRNVQTVEGRKTTVFAIELSIDNPDGKLETGYACGCQLQMKQPKRLPQ